MENRHAQAKYEIPGIVSIVNESDIASIKNIVTGVVKIINDPNATAKNLKDLIQIDPPLTARILRVANSDYYSPRSKIGEIEKAVIWIGYHTLKEIVLRQKTNQLFDETEVIEGYTRSELWSFCVAVATFAKLIFRREFGIRSDIIYAAGLLHEIGLIAEEQNCGDTFIDVLKNVNKGEELIISERNILNFTHPELGAAIAASWNLPEEIVAVVRFHHAPYEAPKKHFRICATIFVASIMCHFAEIGYYKVTSFNESLYLRCLNDLNIDQEAVNLIIQDGQLEVAELLEKGVL